MPAISSLQRNLDTMKHSTGTETLSKPEACMLRRWHRKNGKKRSRMNGAHRLEDAGAASSACVAEAMASFNAAFVVSAYGG